MSLKSRHFSIFNMIFPDRMQSEQWGITTNFINTEPSRCWQVKDGNKKICLAEDDRLKKQWHLVIGWENEPVLLQNPHSNPNKQDHLPHTYYCPLKSTILALYSDPIALIKRDTGVIVSMERFLAVAFCTEENFYYRYWQFSGSPDDIESARKIEIWMTALECTPTAFIHIPMDNRFFKNLGFNGIEIQKSHDPLLIHRAAVRAWLDFNESTRQRLCYNKNALLNPALPKLFFKSPVAASATTVVVIIILRIFLGWMDADRAITKEGSNHYTRRSIVETAGYDNQTWRELHRDHYSKVYPPYIYDNVSSLLQIDRIGELSAFYWDGHSGGSFDIQLQRIEQFDDIWELLTTNRSQIAYWLNWNGMQWLSRTKNQPVMRVEFKISERVDS